MTHVFINIENPKRIKMINARNMSEANNKLAERLGSEYNSGVLEDYVFGYYI